MKAALIRKWRKNISKEETGVTVEVTDVPYADLLTKITKAVQADDAPEVVRVSTVQPDWNDHLMDLSDIASEAKTLESMTIKDEADVVKALLLMSLCHWVVYQYGFV